MDLGEKKFIFIIGSERSGTTWLMNMISQHADVCSVAPSELTIFNRYVIYWEKSWQLENSPNIKGKSKLGLATVFSPDQYRSIVSSFIQDVYSEVAKKNANTSHILDKCPAYSLYVDLINKYIPQSRFVHIIRDGRDVAVSMRSVKERIGFSQAEVSEAIDKWKEYVLSARKARKFGPERYMEVRYEDLLRDTESELASVLNFCNLRPDNIGQIVAENHIVKKKLSYTNPEIDAKTRLTGSIWKKKLSVIKRGVVYGVAGDLMVQLGYVKPDIVWKANRVFHFCLVFFCKLIKRLKITLKILFTGEL